LNLLSASNVVANRQRHSRSSHDSPFDDIWLSDVDPHGPAPSRDPARALRISSALDGLGLAYLPEDQATPFLADGCLRACWRTGARRFRLPPLYPSRKQSLKAGGAHNRMIHSIWNQSAMRLSGCAAAIALSASGSPFLSRRPVLSGPTSGGSAAHSDDVSHRFRPKPATCSDRSQPGIPMIPAGVAVRIVSG